MDANRRGQDGRANGEEIRTTATVKEKQKERATHGVDTVAAMVVAATEGRRKRRKRRHHRSLSSSEEDNEEGECKRRSPSSGDEGDGDSGGG